MYTHLFPFHWVLLEIIYLGLNLKHKFVWGCETSFIKDSADSFTPRALWGTKHPQHFSFALCSQLAPSRFPAITAVQACKAPSWLFEEILTLLPGNFYPLPSWSSRLFLFPFPSPVSPAASTQELTASTCIKRNFFCRHQRAAHLEAPMLSRPSAVPL